jgi:two-component system LytT family response regulator
VTTLTDTLSVIIADDEPLARQLLRVLLEAVPGVELIAECSNGRDAIVKTRELSPDLLILDIKMPGLSGFDVVVALQSDTMPMVVFCTAYQRYAVDAFDLHAVDYLLKPVGHDRLARAVERARERFRLSGGADRKTPLVGAIDEIAQRIGGRTDDRASAGAVTVGALPRDRLAVKNPEGTVMIDTSDLDWVDAAGDYMCLHVKGETLIMRSTLKDLMARLDPDRFRRIHRSTVVNLDRIVRLQPLQKGEYMIELDCDQSLKVSRNYRQAIKQFLDQQ